MRAFLPHVLACLAGLGISRLGSAACGPPGCPFQCQQTSCAMNANGNCEIYLDKTTLNPATGSTGIPSIDEVVKGIEEAESLFANLELTAQDAYFLGENAHYREGTVSSQARNVRAVTIGDRFRLDISSDITPVGGEAKQVDYAHAFDGEKTTILDGPMGNERNDRTREWNNFRPHMLFVRNNGIDASLSVFVRGGEGSTSIMGSPQSKSKGAVVGLETIDSLETVKLKVGLWTSAPLDGPPEYEFFLWLCPKRHYLPVKWEARNSWFGEVAASEGGASDWREIVPGIWFPFTIERMALEPYAFIHNKEKVLAWRDELKLSEVNLDPHYDDSFFSVEFPTGTIVYTVVDGNMIEQRMEGGVPDEATSGILGFGDARWWWLFLAVALCLIGAAIWKRKRTTSQMDVSKERAELSNAKKDR